MPATYVSIATTTLGSAAADITFTAIPATYTDLIVAVFARSDYADTQVAGFIRVGNGSIDTGSNYSRTRLLGTGSAISSARGSNLTALSWDAITGATAAANIFCTTIIQINNYSNTTTNKTILIRSNEPGTFLAATVGLWRSTSAIDQLRIYGDGAADLAAGTSVTLYGIKAA
jgi:hypothetical protein